MEQLALQGSPSVANARGIYENERKEGKGRKNVVYSIKRFKNLNKLTTHEIVKYVTLIYCRLFSLQRLYISNTLSSLTSALQHAQITVDIPQHVVIDMHHVPKKQVLNMNQKRLKFVLLDHRLSTRVTTDTLN